MEVLTLYIETYAVIHELLYTASCYNSYACWLLTSMQSEQVEQHTTLTPLVMSVSEMSYDPPQRQVSEYIRQPVDREVKDTNIHLRRYTCGNLTVC